MLYPALLMMRSAGLAFVVGREVDSRSLGGQCSHPQALWTFHPEYARSPHLLSEVQGTSKGTFALLDIESARALPEPTSISMALPLVPLGAVGWSAHPRHRDQHLL